MFGSILAVFFPFSKSSQRKENGNGNGNGKKGYIKKQENRENTQATRSHRQNGMKSPDAFRGGRGRARKTPKSTKNGGVRKPQRNPKLSRETGNAAERELIVVRY